MFQKLVCIFSAGFLFVSLAGCATFRKSDLELQDLRNQVGSLEEQLQQKEREVTALRAELVRQKQIQTETAKKISIQQITSQPSMKQIQAALKKAGFDPGPIDGKKGKRTYEAIIAFQKKNGLAADGKVGRRTWMKLKQYLN